MMIALCITGAALACAVALLVWCLCRVAANADRRRDR